MSKKHSKFKKHLLTILFVAINIAVIAFTAFSEFGKSENADKFSNVKIKWYFILPAIICFAVALTLEIFKYVILMRKTAYPEHPTLKNAWKTARRTVIIGKYYDNITPAAIGGQPFQIYYMNKSGLPNGIATSIPIVAMISGQIGFLIVAILSFLFGFFTTTDVTLVAAACFGLLFYAFWPIVILVATFLPKGTSEIIILGVKFLAKLHIIKDPVKAVEKANENVAEYSKCVKTILKTKGLFLKTILLSVGFHFFTASIPFFVLNAFGGEINYISCFVLTVAVTSAVYYIPTPGNAGAAEGTFYTVFSRLSTGYVFWAMLFWRFFSYYLYIIMGAVTYFIMHVEKQPEDSWWTKFKDFFKNIAKVLKTKD